jgi:Putative Ig domain/Domain of unknown function (DUF2341)
MAVSKFTSSSNANDFNLNVQSTYSSVTLDREYPSGSYSITSSAGDTTIDIYAYNSLGTLVGYTGNKAFTATAGFSKLVVIGGTTGDVLGFAYKTTFSTAAETAETTAGPVLTGATPTSLPNQNQTLTLTGLNFNSAMSVTFTGTDSIARSAKAVNVTSSTSATVTRPDSFPIAASPYTISATNPGVNAPIGTNSYILNSPTITAGVNPIWSTTSVPSPAYNVSFSTQLSATDADSGSGITNYVLASGALPPGLSLSSGGVISGTCTVSTGTYNFTVTATDSGGNTATSSTLTMSPSLYIAAITSTIAVTNYQVLLTVNYKTGVRSDFADLKITQSGTSCSYWIETYTASTTAQVWVKVPTISIGTNYLNISADGTTGNSNGSNTFDWFEDFTAGNFNKFSVTNSTGLTITSSGVPSGTTPTKSNVNCMKMTSTTAVLFGNATWNSGTANYENITRAYVPSPSSNLGSNGFTVGGFGINNDAVNQASTLRHPPDSFYIRANTTWYYGSSFSAGAVPSGGTSFDIWIRQQVKMVPGSVSAIHTDSAGRVLTLGGVTLTSANMNGPMFGQRGDWSYSGQTGLVWVDWSFVRKASATEPTVAVA